MLSKMERMLIIFSKIYGSLMKLLLSKMEPRLRLLKPMIKYKRLLTSLTMIVQEKRRCSLELCGQVIPGMVLAITNNTISLHKTSQALVQTELQLQKLMVSQKMVKQSRTMSTVHVFAEERRLIAFTFSTGSLFISDN